MGSPGTARFSPKSNSFLAPGGHQVVARLWRDQSDMWFSPHGDGLRVPFLGDQT